MTVQRAMASMFRDFIGVSFLVHFASPHMHESDYVKYPLHDGYVRSCSQKEENFGYSEELQVRRYMPNIRTREWSQDSEIYHEGDTHGTTSRQETRHYHRFDDRSMNQLESGEANIIDYFTDTRGIETTSYEYPHLTGPYQTNLDEGTLNPYDQSAIAGWCGEDSAGDRVSFLLFDMTDFDKRAVGKATLRMTPKKFPFNSKVQVRGACDISVTNHNIRKHVSAHGATGGIDPSLDASLNAYGGNVAMEGSDKWHEESLTWNNAPFIHDDETDKVICEWASGDEDVYHDDGLPYECDVTEIAQKYANQSFCLTLDMVHEESNSRDSTVFYSKDYQGENNNALFMTHQKQRRSDLSSSSSSHNNGQHISDDAGGRSLSSMSRHEREQWFEGNDIWRSDKRALISDPLMGNARLMKGGNAISSNPYSSLSNWFSSSTDHIPSLYSESSTMITTDDTYLLHLPGLEFGTIRRYQGGASKGTASSYKFSGGRTGGYYGNTRPGGSLYNGGRLDGGGGGRGAFNNDARDAAATRRPHLIIEGTKCGEFPDHSAREGFCH